MALGDRGERGIARPAAAPSAPSRARRRRAGRPSVRYMTPSSHERLSSACAGERMHRVVDRLGREPAAAPRIASSSSRRSASCLAAPTGRSPRKLRAPRPHSVSSLASIVSPGEPKTTITSGSERHDRGAYGRSTARRRRPLPGLSTRTIAVAGAARDRDRPRSRARPRRSRPSPRPCPLRRGARTVPQRRVSARTRRERRGPRHAWVRRASSPSAAPTAGRARAR